MANHQSSVKRIRQTEKRRLHNKYYAKTMRNAIRDLRELDKKEEALVKLREVVSLLDRLAKKNVIHENKAGNLKSKLTKSVNALAELFLR